MCSTGPITSHYLSPSSRHPARLHRYDCRTPLVPATATSALWPENDISTFFSFSADDSEITTTTRKCFPCPKATNYPPQLGSQSRQYSRPSSWRVPWNGMWNVTLRSKVARDHHCRVTLMNRCRALTARITCRVVPPWNISGASMTEIIRQIKPRKTHSSSTISKLDSRPKHLIRNRPISCLQRKYSNTYQNPQSVAYPIPQAPCHVPPFLNSWLPPSTEKKHHLESPD